MLFTKKYQLEKQLMAEIKSYAGVNEFPLNDAKIISQLLVAYNKGEPFVGFAIMSSRFGSLSIPRQTATWLRHSSSIVKCSDVGTLFILVIS